MDITLLILLSKWKSLFSKFTIYPFKAVSTRAVEQVGSLQDFSVPDEGFCVLPEQEGLSFIHLTVLHHLQPLTVVPAELLSLDLLPPLLVVFLERRGGRRGSSGGRQTISPQTDEQVTETNLSWHCLAVLWATSWHNQPLFILKRSLRGDTS